jgi:hypothetical protein
LSLPHLNVIRSRPTYKVRFTLSAWEVTVSEM